MGCCNSVPNDLTPSSVQIEMKPEDQKPGAANTPSDPAGTKATDARKSVGDAEFDAWSTMEAAEEMSYLAQEEDTAEIDAALEREFPHLKKKQSELSEVDTWKIKMNDITQEEGDFELSPPFTKEKASAFYRHLCQTDERRRNPARAEDKPSISRRSVYNVLVAAYELYDEKARSEGAMQDVPAPTGPSEKLRVCGDTHGQLQDVLWIFDEHGEPSSTNRYLFNGDIADRGKYALDIFLLLLTFQLADPTCMYINRGNHEQRDLNERPFANGGGVRHPARTPDEQTPG